jgi:hypothetical protein
MVLVALHALLAAELGAEEVAADAGGERPRPGDGLRDDPAGLTI